jgi:hypothetical protein
VKALATEKVGVIGRLATGGDQARIPDVGDEGQVQGFEDLVWGKSATNSIRAPLFKDILPGLGIPACRIAAPGSCLRSTPSAVGSLFERDDRCGPAAASAR